MKKLIFKENFRAYRKGDVAVVADNHAKVLLALGKAEKYISPRVYETKVVLPEPVEEPVRRGRKKKVVEIQSDPITDVEPFEQVIERETDELSLDDIGSLSDILKEE